MERLDIKLDSLAHAIHIGAAVRILLHYPQTVQSVAVISIETEIVERLLLARLYGSIDRQFIATDVRADEKRNASGTSANRRPRKRIGEQSGFFRKVAVSLQNGNVLR